MSFSFAEQKIKLPLEIEGKVYQVNPFSEKCTTALQDWQEALKDKSDNDTPLSQKIEYLCQQTGALVDAILGEGTYQEIFAGKETTLYDHRALVEFLVSEIAMARLVNSVKLVGGKLALDEAAGLPEAKESDV